MKFSIIQMKNITRRVRNSLQRNKTYQKRYHTQNSGQKDDHSLISMLPIIKNYKSEQEVGIIHKQLDTILKTQIGQTIKVNLKNRLSGLQSAKCKAKSRIDSLSNKNKISLLLNRSVHGKSKYILNKLNKIGRNQNQNKEQYEGIVLNSICSPSETLKCLQLDTNKLKFKRIEDQLYRACTDGDLEQILARRHIENIQQQPIKGKQYHRQTNYKKSYSFRFHNQQRNSIKNIRQKIKNKPIVSKYKFIQLNEQCLSPWQMEESNKFD